MRIAIAGVEHETNTYAADSLGLTGLKAFRQRRGARILELAGTRTYIGGMLEGLDRLEAEPVPLLYALAGPSGTIESTAYHQLKSEIVDGLKAAGGLDAVLLDLHGAGVVEDLEDLESDLASAVRSVVGAGVPIVATLDLHGNITSMMAEWIDLMLGVHEYPHTDMFERGVEAALAVPQLIAGTWQPTVHVERLPMLLPTSTTDMAPASEIRDACRAAEEADERVIDCTFFHGFPYTDVSFAGASVVVTTNNDTPLAQQVASSIAAQVWARRDEFRVEALSPEAAIRRVTGGVGRSSTTSPSDDGPARSHGPRVINETSDNPGAGTPGDGTHFLRALVDAVSSGIDLGRVCYGAIFDPATARQAVTAGPGKTIHVRLGAKHDTLHGTPIEAPAYVRCLTDGRFTYRTPMFAGLADNWGPLVALNVGGIEVLVTSRRSQVFDDRVFALCGIEIAEYDLVVVKSSQHFRAGFRDVAREIMTVDTPGLSTLAVEIFEPTTADGARWPHDPTTAWEPTIVAG